MMKKICLILFYKVISGSFGYERGCPVSSEWRLRSRAMNCTGKYVCLQRLPEYDYVEKCNGPDLSNKGTKLVFQPHFNNAKCSENRYQPFRFSTEGTSRCIYKKSYCNEDGQFVFNNGSFKEDTRCMCNFLKGYDFVTKPRNNCFCIPSKEDCSCYKRTCKKKDRNDQCLENGYGFTNTSCQQIDMKMSEETNIFGQLPEVKVETANYSIDEYHTGGIISTSVLVVLMITSVLLIGYLCRKGETQELEKADVVPPKENDVCCTEIEKWKQKEKTFVLTRACKKVQDIILSDPCVVVTGVSGCGKSSIIWHVALTLENEHDYTLILIKKAADLKEYYKRGAKTVFVLDDVWGKFTADKQSIDSWNLILDFVRKVVSDSSCKILLSCRLQVFRDTKLSDSLFKNYECNITSDELCLTFSEKTDIFKIWVNKDLDQVDVLYGNNHLFPLLCELYSKERKHNIENYFTIPYKIYSTELEYFKSHDKYKLCGLALCVIFNDKLKISDLKEMKVDFRQKICSICQHLQLKIKKGKYEKKIKNALYTLDGTYVKVQNDFYETIHDKLFDILAYYFGKKMIECLIEHGDSKFIRERFRLRDSKNKQGTEMEYIIDLEENLLQTYIKRLTFDWMTSKISDVFYNINMRNDLFREGFINYLDTSLPTEELKKTLVNMYEPFSEDCEYGNTPLIISSLEGHIDSLKWLIHHGAKVNYQRGDGVSALYMASLHGYVDIVKILLQNAANANDRTSEGVTPLGSVCYYSGNSDIVHELLNCNADVNTYRYCENNMTPLFMACLNDFVKIVEILLSNKADPNICLNDGYSPLLISCIKGQADVVRLLLHSGADFNYELSGGYTPLFFAASFGFPAIVELLLNKGSDQTKRVAKKEEIEKELNPLLTTPNSTSCDNTFKTWSWFEHIVPKCSSTLKAYVNTKPIDYIINVLAESTPLHAACFMGYSKITKLLIREISNVDIQKSDGTTPLFYACELGHTGVVIALIEKGANPRICRAGQISPIQIAKDNGHNQLLQLMEKE